MFKLEFNGCKKMLSNQLSSRFSTSTTTTQKQHYVTLDAKNEPFLCVDTGFPLDAFDIFTKCLKNINSWLFSCNEFLPWALNPHSTAAPCCTAESIAFPCMVTVRRPSDPPASPCRLQPETASGIGMQSAVCTPLSATRWSSP